MDNPYQAPTSLDSVSHSGPEVSPDVIRALAGTKGWVRFIAVLGFIVTAIMLLACLGMLLGGNTSRGFYPMNPSVLAGVYFVVTVLYFYTAFKLNQYASKIGSFIFNASQENLVLALDAQRGFWKFVGIMVIIVIVAYLLVIVMVASLFAM